MPAPTQEILLATMTDVRPLASILKSLSFRHQATVKIDAKGLRFTVEEGRGLQAHAYIASSSFSTYSFTLSPTDPAALSLDNDVPLPPSPSSFSPPEVDPSSLYCHTSISLSTLLECLNIFGNSGGSSAGGGKWGKSGGGRGEREGTSFDDEGEGYGGRGRRRQGGGGGEEEDAPVMKERTSLRISYKGLGEPLVMLLEESGIVTRCELTTYEPEGLLDLAFPDDERQVRLIMKSEWLRDALLELPPSSEKLTISFAPPHLVSHTHAQRGRYKRQRREDSMGFEIQEEEEQQEEEDEEVPLFRLESTGTLGSTEMDYSDDKDVLEVFECEAPVRNTYKFSHIQLTKQALNASTKTSIRTAPSGLVSFQFMIPLAGGARPRPGQEEKLGFVEFLCVALDEDY